VSDATANTARACLQCNRKQFNHGAHRDHSAADGRSQKTFLPQSTRRPPRKCWKV